ncbi:hypothetical protein C2845_PM02G35390 [Panicum miliaceum]|uniref:Uncharacterized protein n=1 Tax=Panicum miliaceum TaxID=4540 RepID=A0A3L6SFP5_PANMI|nr:hypothetical protein C2845_PM02G35390 [Panicum miliaceum]
MSKRPRNESKEEDDAETRRGFSPRRRVCLVPWSHSLAARQRCLYLVLDDWKRGYSVHRHSGATLMYMGDSRFCLIESLVTDPNQSLRVLRITSFGLKYDKGRELVTAQYIKTRPHIWTL